MMVSEYDEDFGGEPVLRPKHVVFQPFVSAKTCQPEDIASTVSYLASQAAHFITGKERNPMLPTVCIDDHH